MKDDNQTPPVSNTEPTPSFTPPTEPEITAPEPMNPVQESTTSSDTPFGTTVTPPAEQPSSVAPSEVESTTDAFTATATPDQIAQTPVPATPVPPKKSKKKFIIGGVIAAVLALLIGGGALAYVAYQNPERVVLDGFVNLAKAKSGVSDGTMTVKSDEAEVKLTYAANMNESLESSAKMTVSVKSDALDLGDDAIEVDAELVNDKEGTLYFKVNNLDKVLDTTVQALIKQQSDSQVAIGGQPYSSSQSAMIESMVKAQFQPIVDKINNKWISVSADDYNTSDDQKDVQKCVLDAYRKFMDDAGVQNELIDAYQKNRFILIKEELGVKDGNLGYVLDIDKEKAKSFGEAAEDSQFAKDLKACDEDAFSSSSSDSTRSDDSESAKVEVWVSQWSHELKTMKISGEDDGTEVAIEANFDTAQNPTVEIPENATPAKEIIEDFQQMSLGGATQSPATTRLGAGSF